MSLDFRGVLFRAFLLAVFLSEASGQPAVSLSASVPEPGANGVIPTVTAEMGHRGGTLFGRIPHEARTRRYFIAAETEPWDYTPEGLDPVCGKPLPPPVVAQRPVGKIRYVQYTDASFTTKVFQNPRLGILGPVLRGVVGEVLAVTFLNRSSRPLSMHPHGVRYDKDSEGSYYRPRPGLGSAVAPGARFTYAWELDETSGPAPGEPSSKGWLYHSHVNGDEEANLGLVGFLIVTDPRRARPDGTPADVDREQAALFMVFDESGLGEAEREAAEYASLDPNLAANARPSWQVQEQIEQGARHAINGRLFGNLSGLEANEGERVRWYLFGLGSEKDFHTAHWHGGRVIEEGRRTTDTVELLPGTMKIADLRADNPGSWLFHCHVADHMTEGMFARFTVHPKGGPLMASGPAFFGDAGSLASLRIRSAESRITGTAAAVHLSGGATVLDGFSVFNEPFEIELAGLTVRFTPDRAGRFRSESAEFTIRNASPFGVVYGGEMEFSLMLRGEAWRKAFQVAQASAQPPASEALRLPFRMQIGPAVHRAIVELKPAASP